MFTNYLAQKSGGKALVIRFNGGAQAGHTVVKDNIRHVFGHFGSGSIAGNNTFLSKYFISNPIAFRQEHEKLLKLGIYPKVYVDNRSIVTTPWDILINQYKELKRSNNKHGSCGMGIHETIIRSKDPFNNMITQNIHDNKDWLKDLLSDIRRYCLRNAYKLELHNKCIDLINNKNIFDRFIKDCEYFKEHTTIINNSATFLQQQEHIIFEGAQGLMLDQNHKNFPHVTHSNTGYKNVNSIINDNNITLDNVNVYYMTRGYVTRHGSGPMNDEREKPYDAINDTTNVPNEWQDSLRYGYLDLDVLIDEIDNDKDCIPLSKVTDVNLVITCMDQIPEDMYIIMDGNVLKLQKNEVLKIIYSKHVFDNIYTSNHPSGHVIRQDWLK
jgi:adenylosuccinate synthase